MDSICFDVTSSKDLNGLEQRREIFATFLAKNFS
jgi:hypothetical protein